MSEHKDTEERKEKHRDNDAIQKIKNSMEKDQYYLLCQYAIGIVEAKSENH